MITYFISSLVAEVSQIRFLNSYHKAKECEFIAEEAKNLRILRRRRRAQVGEGGSNTYVENVLPDKLTLESYLLCDKWREKFT